MRIREHDASNADAIASLRLARAHLLDAAGLLSDSGRHDAALLAQHCDKAEQDVLAIESAMDAR